MKHTRRVFWSWLVKKLAVQFVAGIIAVAPIGATILILVWIFSGIDNVLQPVIKSIWGRTMPGVGFGVTIVLIYLAGVIASNILGKRLIHYGESLMARIPVVRLFYTGIKQILEALSGTSKTGFMQVVLVEFPRKGMKAIGFVTKEFSDESGEKLLNIFIPTAPNPTTGFLQIVREAEVVRTDIAVDDAVKMVVSAGSVTPKWVSDKLSERS